MLLLNFERCFYAKCKLFCVCLVSKGALWDKGVEKTRFNLNGTRSLKNANLSYSDKIGCLASKYLPSCGDLIGGTNMPLYTLTYEFQNTLNE